MDVSGVSQASSAEAAFLAAQRQFEVAAQENMRMQTMNIRKIRKILELFFSLLLAWWKRQTICITMRSLQ